MNHWEIFKRIWLLSIVFIFPFFFVDWQAANIPIEHFGWEAIKANWGMIFWVSHVIWLIGEVGISPDAAPF